MAPAQSSVTAKAVRRRLRHRERVTLRITNLFLRHDESARVSMSGSTSPVNASVPRFLNTNWLVC